MDATRKSGLGKTAVEHRYIITSSAQDNNNRLYVHIDYTGVENSSLYRAATAGLEAKL